MIDSVTAETTNHNVKGVPAQHVRSPMHHLATPHHNCRSFVLRITHYECIHNVVVPLVGYLAAQTRARAIAATTVPRTLPASEAHSRTAAPLPAGASEALIAASALAALAIQPGADGDDARDMVADYLACTTHAEVLAWHQPPPRDGRPRRWDTAKDVLIELYPELLVGKTLPESYVPDFRAAFASPAPA